MKLAIYAVATVASLAATPSFAASVTTTDRPITLAQDVRIERDGDRPYWRHRHEGCREVTIRERHGGEMVVRHIRRCD
jgi:hypothetical protein